MRGRSALGGSDMRAPSLLFTVLAGLASPAGAQLELGKGLAGDVTAYAVDGSRSRVVFLLEGANGPALFGVTLAARPLRVRLSGADLVEIGADFVLAADGSRAVFRGRRAGAASAELLASPLDGSAPALSLPLPAVPGALAAFELDPSGEWVVLLFGAARREHLYSARSDGSAGPLELNPPLGTGRAVTDFLLAAAPDGPRAVLRADFLRDAWFELFSVPLDRSLEPVRLNGDLALHGDVADFGISPDGGTVIYLAEERATDQLELFARPIDGTGAPVPLSSPPVPGGDVHQARVTPDGGRVLYLADQEVDERIELFSAPLDGSLGAVRLSGPLGPTADVLDFRASPRGTRVVYLLDETFGLFGAPADGSGPPFALQDLPSGPIPCFELAPDGRRVVALVATGTGELELRVLPSVRAASPARVASAGSGFPAPGLALPAGEARPFAFTPDGRTLVFLARPTGFPAAARGLYRVPLDGSEKPARLDGAQGGNVLAFELALGGREVVFSSETPRGPVQLWLTSLEY
jgi:hypothetical protein